MTEIGFDPESVYHVVELVGSNQSALQSWTLKSKVFSCLIFDSFSFCAPLN